MSGEPPAKSADGGDVHNVVEGDVHGVLFQARDVHGDVTIHAPGRKPVVPRQLPGAIRDFVGRRAELNTLTATLDEAAGTGMVVVSAIEGSAGIGKTTLAVYWAHLVEERFPDGQLYVNLAGFDPDGEAMEPAVAVRGFLDALEVPPARIPANLDAQAALYRSLVAQRRMLVVLDNCRDSAHARPLLPGGSSCMVIVTSRSRLHGLVTREGARRIELGLLTIEEAKQLLAARVGGDRVGAEPEAVAALIELCARLPLALGIAAARAAERPGSLLADVVGELEDELHHGRARLEEFDLGEVDVNLRAVFSWSYRALSPEAASLFRLLGLHPGPEIGIPAVAALSGLPVDRARRLLRELVNAHLLEEFVPGRFQFHDLLRAYALDRAGADGTKAGNAAATTRVLDFYLHTAFNADRQLFPHREPIEPATPTEPVRALTFGDHDAAQAWFLLEYLNLLAALDRAVEAGADRQVWQLSWALATYMDRQAHWRDWTSACERGLAAAIRLDDVAGQARMRFNLATAYAQRERNAEANDQIRQSLALFQELGDRVCEAHAHHSSSWIMARQEQRFAEGLEHAKRALALHREVGNRFGEAEALNTVGWLYGLLDDHEQNLACCQEALVVLEELGQRHSMAFTVDHIGDAYRNLGRAAEAVTYHRRAVELFHEVGMAYEEAVAVGHLGDAAFAMGDHDAARAAWQRGSTIFVQLERSEAATLKEKLEALPVTE